jgi:hypothetical protein
MFLDALGRVAGTCVWGRFGIMVEQVTAHDCRVDEVFWACRHPVLAPDGRPVRRTDCEECALWAPASRFLPEVSS